MSSTQPAMQPRNPYLRLMRLHQPVGIWLVYWPCVWAILLVCVSHATETARFLALVETACLYIPLFFLGAITMRAAGCIINDMADRDFDRHVERTKTRPLASGELTMAQAAKALAALGIVALFLLWLLLDSLPAHVAARELLLVSLPVAALIIAYPFMKRITWWPQAFLGLTFNWGALIGWMAMDGQLSAAAWLLYAACFFWTLGYDTIYGHQDKRDDAKIGIKSTSRHLERHSKLWVGSFYLAMLLLFTACGLATLSSPLAILINGLILLGLSLIQLLLWEPDTPENCLRMFKSNVYSGGILALWLMILVAHECLFSR